MANPTTNENPPKPMKAPKRSERVLEALRKLGLDVGFPLFPHMSGRWAKKVRVNGGDPQWHYFGPLADPVAALNRWLDEKDDLLAGRTPRAKSGGLTVRDLVNHFLTTKASARKTGELSDRTFADYYETCERIISNFGERRFVSDLRPDDFGAFRGVLAKTRGPVTLGNEVQRVRTVFKYAFDNDLMPAPVKFGTLFKKPSKTMVRIHRSQQPKRLFAADEIRTLISKSDEQMKAMILLGINCGWGNKDVAEVRESHFDFARGVAMYSRRKTGVDRRATLWPETVKAVQAAIKVRPKATDELYDGYVFITRWGNPWRVSSAVTDLEAERKVRRSETDSVGLEFGKLLRKVTVKRGEEQVGMKREGVNFYTLRHTFKTIAEGAGDIPAVDRIMGHEDGDDVGTHYREWDGSEREDARLRRVTNHVRRWLFGRK